MSISWDNSLVFVLCWWFWYLVLFWSNLNWEGERSFLTFRLHDNIFFVLFNSWISFRGQTGFIFWNYFCSALFFFRNFNYFNLLFALFIFAFVLRVIYLNFLQAFLLFFFPILKVFGRWNGLWGRFILIFKTFPILLLSLL